MSWISPEVEPSTPPRTAGRDLPVLAASLLRTASLLLVLTASLLLVLTASLLLVGCGDASEAAGLADDLAPHEEAIGRFVHWAERTTGAALPRERARLDETLFAPVRAEPRFRTVVVELSGGSPLRAVHPEGAEVPEIAWRSVRSRTLGVLEAGRDARDEGLVWARLGRDGLRVIVAVAREAPSRTALEP